MLHIFRRRADFYHTAPQEVVKRLLTLDPDDFDGARSILDEYVSQEWEARWAATTKGVAKNYINPSHWTTQLLTGHGKFAEKLAGFRLKDSGNGLCGMPETPDHVLFDSSKPRYDALRHQL